MSLTTTSFAGQGRRTVDGNYLKWVDENGVVKTVKLEAMEVMLIQTTREVSELASKVEALQEEIKCLQKTTVQKTPATVPSSGKKAKPGPSSGSPTRKPVPSKT